MRSPEYPLLTVTGYELYQLAHLTTVVVDALARHRRAAAARNRLGRRAAAAAEIPTSAADAGSTRANGFPGGFPAAAGALPGPRATAPHTPVGTRRHNTAARPGPAAASRPAPSSQQTPAP